MSSQSFITNFYQAEYSKLVGCYLQDQGIKGLCLYSGESLTLSPGTHILEEASLLWTYTPFTRQETDIPNQSLAIAT